MGKKEIYVRRTLRRRSTKMRVISNCSRLGKATGLRTTGGAASTTQRAGRRVSCFGTRKTQAGSRFVTRALFGGAGAMEPLPALKEIKLKDIDNRAIQPKKYVVEFQVTEKVNVNGPDTHPFFKYLKEKGPKSFLGNDAKWNFEKFLVDKDGNVVKRYLSTTSPLAIEKDIKKLL